MTRRWLGDGAILEVTIYSVGLRDHFDMFNRIRSDRAGDSFPACQQNKKSPDQWPGLCIAT